MPPKKRQSKARGGSVAKRAKLSKAAAKDADAAAASGSDDSEDSPAEVAAPASASTSGKGKAAAAAAGKTKAPPAAKSSKAKKAAAAVKADAVAAPANSASAGSSAAAAVPGDSVQAKDASGRPWRLKLASWNINGLRAWLKANGTRYVTEEAPFIIGVQEIKCPSDKVPPEAQIPGYHAVFSSADKGGYAGTGIYSREKPLSVREGIGAAAHDSEGRVITAEFPEFYFVTAYVPNSGRELARLKYRTAEWDKDFAAYLRRLDSAKPVVVCGDLNVAHAEIDLANPKTNQRTAGFTKEERGSFTSMLQQLDLVDTFRQLHPEQAGAYTFWSYMRNARAKNIGWRLDYFLVSRRLADRVCDSLIRSNVTGSDHCPIVLLLSL